MLKCGLSAALLAVLIPVSVSANAPAEEILSLGTLPPTPSDMLPVVPDNPDLRPVFEPSGHRARSETPSTRPDPTPPPATRARLVHQVAPDYPGVAAAAHWSGKVDILVHVDAAGRPYKTAVASRTPEHIRIFDDAARLAAMASRFEPARDAQGRAVADARVMPFNFVTDEGASPASCQLNQDAAIDYPKAAREQGIEARMTMAVPVDRTGRIDASRVVILSRGAQSTGLFDDSARKAAAQARCTPATLDGEAVEGWGTVEVAYTLSVEPRPYHEGTYLAPEQLENRVTYPADLPAYPASARYAGLEGKVTVQVDIDMASGKAVATRIVQRSPYYADFLDETARRWAMQMRYQPSPEAQAAIAPQKNQAAFTTITQPVNFILEEDGFVEHHPAHCKLRRPPAYPDSALALGKEARILVSAVVQANGRIRRSDTRVASRLPRHETVFDESAIAAVHQARCSPTYSDGRARPVSLVLVEVDYTLQPDEAPPLAAGEARNSP